MIRGFAFALAHADAGVAADPAPIPIVGGQTTAPGEFDSVVALAFNGHSCSGTVVAPRLVLTAAHCLVDIHRLRDLEVYAGDDVSSGRSLAIAAIGVSPTYDPDVTHVDNHDFGYIVLGESFTPRGGFVPPIATPAEWDEVMRRGQSILVVGFGEDPSVPGMFHGSGIKRFVETTIRELTPEGTEFYAGGDQIDSCNGDSGGPAFVRMPDGTLRLAGVTSRGSMVCGSGGYYGVPYAALCWLRDETDVDLVAPGCDACDCIDTAPPADNGCGVTDERSGRGMLALVVITVGTWQRRRRRCVTRVRPTMSRSPAPR